jgi:colanic acid biosynthesis protein WcaH
VTLFSEALTEIKNPSQGLPDAAFEFALRIVPMINVDLLVRNQAGEHLLSWRDDEYDRGWHIPGGIIRFNESIDTRIAEVGASELACEVQHDRFPDDIKEFFTPRGHFISLMFLCTLSKQAARGLRVAPDPYRAEHGDLAWHRGVPPNMYSVHRVYSDWLNGRTRDRESEKNELAFDDDMNL